MSTQANAIAALRPRFMCPDVKEKHTMSSGPTEPLVIMVANCR